MVDFFGAWGISWRVRDLILRGKALLAMLDAAGIGVDPDSASIFGMGRGFRLEPQFSNQLLHYDSPLELLRYEFRPGVLVALDFATVLVEAKP